MMNCEKFDGDIARMKSDILKLIAIPAATPA
jgi:hypothetical protein